MIKQEQWEAVKDALSVGEAIAFDGCHKIYILMDDEEVAQMKSYGYGQDDDGSVLVTIEPDQPMEAYFALVQGWFEDSCGLRFIYAVRTNKTNPNDGFTTLIGQFDDEDEEDYDEEYEDEEEFND